MKAQLLIKVVIEDPQSKQRVGETVLLDSGCTRTCIDESLAYDNQWMKHPLGRPISVKYADGSSTERSKIRNFVRLKVYAGGKWVLVNALVMWLKAFKMFLGHDWLITVNPLINWKEGTIWAREEKLPL
jgi:hypothetical protein